MAAVAIYDENDENEIVQYWKEFGEISISYCNRSCNSVAHELARQTLLQKSSQVWVDDPPSSILQLLVNDVTVYVNQQSLAEVFFFKKKKLYSYQASQPYSHPILSSCSVYNESSHKPQAHCEQTHFGLVR